MGLEKRNEHFSAASKMFHTAFLNVCALRADCNSNNAATTTFLPVILSHQMYALHVRELYDVVKVHRERLSMTHNAACLLKLENALRAFGNMFEVHKRRGTVTIFRKCTVKTCDLFAKSWAPFAKRLRLPTALCGDLFAVFSRTATV